MEPHELAQRMLKSLRSAQPRIHGWELLLLLRKLDDPGVGGHACFVRTDPEAHPPRMTQIEMLMTAVAALVDEDPTLLAAVTVCYEVMYGNK